MRCPAILLVICLDARTAAWCATPIELGYPDARITPLVLGPDQLSVVTDPGGAPGKPELAVLSAIAHGPDPDRTDVLDSLLAVLTTVDQQRAQLYLDVVLDALPQTAQRYLEALMATPTYEYRSDFARRYYVQGEAKGEARAVLGVLDARGVDVTEDARTRITECTDLAQLDFWVRRAATADSINDLFTD